MPRMEPPSERGQLEGGGPVVPALCCDFKFSRDIKVLCSAWVSTASCVQPKAPWVPRK